MSCTCTSTTHNLRWNDTSRQIKDLWAQGHDETALQLCLDLNQRFPENPAILSKLARAYLRTGQLHLAELSLEAACKHGFAEHQAQTLLEEILWQAGDMPRFLDIAAILCALPGGETRLRLQRLARASLITGAEDKADEFTEKLVRLFPSPDAIKMKYEAILSRLDASEWGPALETRLSNCSDLEEVRSGITLMTQVCGDQPDHIRRLLEKTLATWPEDPLLLGLGLRFGLDPSGILLEAGSPNSSAQEQLDQALEELRKREAAQEDLQPSLIPAFVAQLSPGDLTRPIADISAEKEILVSPRALGSELAVVFTGLFDGTSLPLRVFDAYLSAAGKTAIYMRDFNRLLYGKGIQSLGSDFEAGVQGLRRLISEIGGIEHLTTIGLSAGGIGAINFGLALRADRILCFSTPTTIVQPFLDNIKDHRGRLVLARLNKFVPPDLLDPRRRIMARDNPTRIDLVYGQAMRLDRAHAERLRGFPGVTLYGLEGYAAHTSLNELILRDAFLDTLKGHTERLEALSVSQTVPQ